MNVLPVHSDLPQPYVSSVPTISSHINVRVVIPTTNEMMELPMVTPSDSSSSLADNSIGLNGKEKIGRWTTIEHSLFLEGLEKHGKQWKTIAGMIGTRTVVQVRTHAQKYFQKLDRKQLAACAISSDSSTGSTKDQCDTPIQKRKSVAGLVPGSSKKKSKKAPCLPLTTSNINLPINAVDLIPPTESPVPDFLSFASYVPNSGSIASDGWSTVSPDNVIEEFMDIMIDKSFSNEVDLNCEHHAEGTVASFDFQDLGEDPLEWLVETDSPYLPESSLPPFPDANEPLIESYVAHHTVIDEAILNNMVDPNVTLQSLFPHGDMSEH